MPNTGRVIFTSQYTFVEQKSIVIEYCKCITSSPCHSRIPRLNDVKKKKYHRGRISEMLIHL